MRSRRNFIKKSLLGGFSAPLLQYGSHSASSGLQTLSQKTSSDTDYWAAVRKHFILKEDQVYFNNGTIGPTPAYVINKMTDHLMHYNTHAAETDYKEGSGPELLTGYFAYQALREKIGEIIHADYKNVALIQNATFGMNYVANGLKLKAGDEIINTNQEHGGGYGAWKSLAKRHGLIYKQATMPLQANDSKEIFDAVFK